MHVAVFCKQRITRPGCWEDSIAKLPFLLNVINLFPQMVYVNHDNGENGNDEIG